MKKLLCTFCAICFAANVTYAQGTDPIFWKQAKGPIGGMVTNIAVDSEQHLTISTLPAGFYRSTNRGDTWLSINKGLNRLQGKQVESDGGDYIFATTYYNEFLRFKDTETGWEYLDPGKGVSPLIIIPRFVINSKKNIIAVTTRYGILRSKDHGNNWERIGGPLKDSAFQYIAVGPNDALYTISQGDNIYRSQDDGDTWQKLPTPPPAAGRSSVLCMGVSLNNDILYGTMWGLVIRSSDQGVSWDTVFVHPDQHNIEAMARSGDGALYITTHSDFTDPTQTKTGGFFRSLANGAAGSWVARDQTERGESKFCLAVNKAGEIFHTSVAEGVSRSTDGGATWENKNNTLLANLTTSVVVNSKGSIFTSTSSKVFRSDDGNGDIWLEVNVPTRETPTPPFLRLTANDVLYYSSSFGLFRSDNNGNTWLHVITEDTNGVRFINDVAQLPNGDIMAAVDDAKLGLTVSKDNGYHFEKAPNLPSGEVIVAIASAPRDTVIIANNTSFYYRSDNKGINWALVSSANAGCAQLEIHPDGSYISRSALFLTISLDKGVTWSRIFPDSARQLLRDWTLFSFFIDRLGNLLVTTDSGLYRSAKPYSDWEFVGKGLNASGFDSNQYTSASQLAQNKQTGVFFAASRGQSIFRSTPDLGVNRSISASGSVAAEQNYPNPFSSTTAIRLNMDAPGHVTVKIYDLMGRYRQSIFSGMIDQGEHEIHFNANALPSGNYIYVIEREGEKAESNIMTLSK
jgi:photosystem II stability/assembly factor-like uncharacterized protein